MSSTNNIYLIHQIIIKAAAYGNRPPPHNKRTEIQIWITGTVKKSRVIIILKSLQHELYIRRYVTSHTSRSEEKSS